MKNWILILINVFYLSNTEGVAQQLRANEPSAIKHQAGEILFQLINKRDEPAEIARDIFGESSNSIEIEVISADLNMFKIKFNPLLFNEKNILNQFIFHKKVKAAQFNHLVELRSTTPNDPLYTQQWALPRIGTPSVWDITTGGVTACGDTIVVAVLDQGFDVAHNDLKANIWRNRFEIPNNNIDDDKNGLVDDYEGWNFNTNSDKHTSATHGTNCIGVIGAKGNNNQGVAGINWNVKLMILSGITDDSKIIQAYTYAANQRKKYTQSNGKEGAYVAVSSMSLGFRGAKPAEFPLLCDVYNTLSTQGILNVVAADNIENDIEKSGDVPGLCPNEHLLVVTRTDKDGALPRSAGYSNKYVDLAAPGESIMTTFPSNGFDQVGGNSFAAPLVAGAAALLASFPQDSLCKLARKAPLQAMVILKDAILNGVEPLASLQGKTVTGGQLNVYNSFNRLSRLYGAPLGELSILKIYPNPVSTRLILMLQIPEKIEGDIVISNSMGQVVFQRKIQDRDLLSNKISINTEGLTAGIYFISVLSKDYKTTKKFVVTQP